MERKKAETIAATQLNKYLNKEYLGRDDLASLFGIHYHTLPEFLKKKGYNFGKGERIRLHKEVVKELLICLHMGN